MCCGATLHFFGRPVLCCGLVAAGPKAGYNNAVAGLKHVASPSNRSGWQPGLCVLGTPCCCAVWLRPGNPPQEVRKGASDLCHVAPCRAVLRPAGAGKSTLMDILAMRKHDGSVTGRVTVNGRPATKAFVKQAAYVPQVRGRAGGSAGTVTAGLAGEARCGDPPRRYSGPTLPPAPPA